VCVYSRLNSGQLFGAEKPSERGFEEKKSSERCVY
jgi:hypothetical protein